VVEFLAVQVALGLLVPGFGARERAGPDRVEAGVVDEPFGPRGGGVVVGGVEDDHPVRADAPGRRVAPVHLANEDRLLSALAPAERELLAGLLRRLLSSFESGTIDVAAGLGLVLEPARLARARRQAVGLSDRAGLLVASVQPGSPAHEAGIERGDLLTSLDGVDVISSTGLGVQLENLLGRGTVRAGLLRGNEELTVRLALSAAAAG
jgi:hypothetical protein